MERTDELDTGWSILQDVHDLGETSRIYEPGYSFTDVFTLFSEWEGIDYLSHLQPMLSDTPYFGRELRYFNHSPWWYRNAFPVSADAGECAALRFEGVDYACKVWLNGQYVGCHEGYSSPFGFEVGELLKRGEENLLIVKVSSPWDSEVLPGEEYRRVHRRVCGMFKGTYEHDDTFIARDVNPVGIWGGVSLRFHSGVRLERGVKVTALPSDTGHGADVTLETDIVSALPLPGANARFTVSESDTGRLVMERETQIRLDAGNNPVSSAFQLEDARLWEMWERGRPHLYELAVEIAAGGVVLLKDRTRFGVRRAEIIRTGDTVRFRLNGRDVYLRGSTYFPEVYISRMNRSRYMRDIRNAIQAGINAVRVHVHVARREFYEVCDELGMLVIQDSDFNWTHPVDKEFTARAVGIFSDMVRDLYNHPSIVCWIVMNEPQPTEQRDFMEGAPGPQLVAALKGLDPFRPYIKGSGRDTDPESGDTHDYTGAFGDESCHYLQFDVSAQRLNTEFGMDAPPAVQNLRAVPRLHARMKGIEGKVDELQYYQYRLIKHVIESFRLSRYKPCAGYFQFMFIDLCPQSWYGVYDWWGVPKEGLRAMEESNQPVGVFMKLLGEKMQIWAVNDRLEKLEGLTLVWSVTDCGHREAGGGRLPAALEPGSLSLVWEQPLCLEPGERYRAYLALEDENGSIVSMNRYDDLLNHPAHPKGHSYRMSHELGVRLFDA